MCVQHWYALRAGSRPGRFQAMRSYRYFQLDVFTAHLFDREAVIAGEGTLYI